MVLKLLTLLQGIGIGEALSVGWPIRGKGREKEGWSRVGSGRELEFPLMRTIIGKFGIIVTFF
jgi:hypothetical protein